MSVDNILGSISGEKTMKETVESGEQQSEKKLPTLGENDKWESPVVKKTQKALEEQKRKMAEEMAKKKEMEEKERKKAENEERKKKQKEEGKKKEEERKRKEEEEKMKKLKTEKKEKQQKEEQKKNEEEAIPKEKENVDDGEQKSDQAKVEEEEMKDKKQEGEEIGRKRSLVFCINGGKKTKIQTRTTENKTDTIIGKNAHKLNRILMYSLQQDRIPPNVFAQLRWKNPITIEQIDGKLNVIHSIKSH
jgi:hypothetical protein